MTRWSVVGKVIGSKYLGTFEAETAEEAIDKALGENGSVNLCHKCSSECEDGEVVDAEAEEEES